ncbi:hypothetical protein [Nocardioides sp. WS12]|uniref:hypothetical protein n=1 Tax=Nocardioides sp. WS12 TaxID=2486272 RepID=UPI0015FC3EC2|nr:hypothetical protein [Nocardioides sp. WS12]
MREIGSAAMPIIPVFGNGFKADLERGIGRPMDQSGTKAGRVFGDSAGRSLTASFSSHAKKAALLASGALIGVSAVAFKLGKDSVDQASNLGESVNAVTVAYGKQAKAVQRLGRNTEDALSNVEFNELAVRFSSFAETISGGKGRKTVKTLDDLTTRAGDFASVFNIEVAEAAGLFQSGLAGEAEPLRRYGINLSAAAVEAHAYAKGIAAAGKDLTDTQKIQATYSLLMEKTAKTQGDYAKTADGAANASRRLGANWDDAKAKLGKGLLPIVEDATNFLVDEGVPAFEKFSDWFNDKGIPAISDFADDMKPLAKEILPAAAGALGTVRDALKDAAPYAKDIVEAFNDMPDWAKKGAVLGALGLGVAAKVKGKASGLLGGGSSGGSITDPAYVFVVNGGGSGGKPGVDGGAGKLNGLGLLLGALGGKEVLDGSREMLTGFRDPQAAGGTSANSIKDALNASDFGKYAEDLGINVDALAEGLSKQGAQSQQFKDAVKVLEKTNEGAWEHINDLIPVVGSWIQTNGDHAAFALRDLNEIVKGLSQDLLPLLQGNPTGAGESLDVTKLFGKIPDAKLKVLQDPTTIKTQDDVKALLKNVDGLTKKDYKVLFNILGLSKAKTDAKVLLDYMRELTGMRVPSIPSGVPKGFNGPFRPSGADRLAAGINVGRVEIRGADSDRLIADLQDIARRQAMGGYG